MPDGGRELRADKACTAPEMNNSPFPCSPTVQLYWLSGA